LSIQYLLRRLGLALVIAFVAVTATFFVGQVIGDPIALRYPDMTAELRADVARSVGLDGPVSERYVRYIGGVVRGDLGTSIWVKQPVTEMILERIPATLYLASITLMIALPLALILGVLAAVFVGRWIDRLVTAISLAGVSIVHFWLGLVLVIVFSVTLGWLPTSGYGTTAHVIMPALTLALRPIGRISQFTRNAMVEELNSPYVLTARSRGLPEHRVILHALRNASIPVITIFADDLADLLSGSVIVETVFAWPGVGFLLIQGISQRDLPIVSGVALVVVLAVVTINLIVDLVYQLSDPRIRLAT
jgi:peptide/nickel transport system permease protein